MLLQISEVSKTSEISARALRMLNLFYCRVNIEKNRHFGNKDFTHPYPSQEGIFRGGMLFPIMSNDEMNKSVIAHDDAEEVFPEVVELPLEDVLDLHSFPPKEIEDLVEDYLQAAHEAGFPEVRLIHGKGIGVQREIVRAVAARLPYVQAVTPATEDAGGWGATIIRLTQKT